MVILAHQYPSTFQASATSPFHPSQCRLPQPTSGLCKHATSGELKITVTVCNPDSIDSLLAAAERSNVTESGQNVIPVLREILHVNGHLAQRLATTWPWIPFLSQLRNIHLGLPPLRLCSLPVKERESHPTHHKQPLQNPSLHRLRRFFSIDIMVSNSAHSSMSLP